jgi:hypothetical protein
MLSDRIGVNPKIRVNITSYVEDPGLHLNLKPGYLRVLLLSTVPINRRWDITLK